ncbi:MAG: hypothetical protein ABS38_06840 [Acidovorax sp. SCN 68-22]|uniref:endonuclease NucS n=1 Tax=Acidovorax sp. TaxID=1872122 RepID=UPI00086AD2F6|nr:endonuclease NucS [Acidovorax sp.]MBN9626302.1 DUF91 domain-containing protein [Acidovorax sp.]ODS68348.1 MAG: hypothetical protein ABS38_06840 [Acidovorax sp. SCN 68-22]
MPVELGVWRVDHGLQAVLHQPMANEKKLEDLIEANIAVVAPHLMVIGRQVQTSYGKYVDLLAIDRAGNLAIIELKRDMTPRDVVAQVLDYGSWVIGLQSDQIASIWGNYVEKYRPSDKGMSLDQAFCKRFGLKEMLDELNTEHELIIVASALDDSTERIVEYLAGYHGININAVFFRMFKDGDREYLTRAWLRDPTEDASDSPDAPANSHWNGEYYVSYAGENREWHEAQKYGFIAGGGGTWYSNTLQMLSPGNRVWVNIPGTGYVGVGEVTGLRVPVDDFTFDENGYTKKITDTDAVIATRTKYAESPENAEYLVPVKWIETVPVANAIKEKGFFGNQNTVARPTSPKWVHTVARLKERFQID